MQTNLLIDSIVRQTMVLIGQLSSSAGLRAPLAHIADEVFLNLSGELERQGVPQKVAADMFGLALRSYQRRVQRLRESGTFSGRTLWHAVLEHLEANPGSTKGSILSHFSQDEPEALGATLIDLVKSGLVIREGQGASMTYSPTSSEKWSEARKRKDKETALSLVWLDISRHPGTNAAQVSARLGLDESFASNIIEELLQNGSGTRTPDGALTTIEMVIPVGSEVGWEAAVWDHYTAMVGALTNKLRRSLSSSERALTPGPETTGGATVTFELPSGHPLEQEVLGLLEKFRGEIGELFERVNVANREKAAITEETRRVVFYFGQTVRGEE